MGPASGGGFTDQRPSSPCLAALIAPIDIGEFMDRYWERETLLLRRDEATFYSHLLTMEDVDRILADSGLRASELRVILEGRTYGRGRPKGLERWTSRAGWYSSGGLYVRVC